MHSQRIDPGLISVVSSTYYPKWYKGKLKSIKHTQKIRGDLALESVRRANEIGYRVVVVDGMSSKTFLKEISLLKSEKFRLIRAKNHGRSPNRRRAIREASKNEEIKVIILTELEKLSIITDCVDLMAGPIIEEKADLVIPSREDNLWLATYPHYMYESEREGNIMFNEELRSHGLITEKDKDLDVFFGPRAFKNNKRFLRKLLRIYSAKKIISLFQSSLFDLEEYSNVLFFPVVKALDAGDKVVSVSVPFKYPTIQKKNEVEGNKEHFILKRKYQRLTIIVELMHFLAYLDKKKSRIRSVKRQ